jgi:predicted metalloprotease with PDZ domain
MLSLMKELSNTYGVNKPFDDESLIVEITEMTYPSVGEFLNTHVVDGVPIDYSKFIEKVGLTFEGTPIETGFIQSSRGSIFAADEDRDILFFSSNVKDNSFWAENGVQENDIIKTFNGTDVSISNARAILMQLYSAQIGDDINVVLDRNGEDIVINTKLYQAYTTKFDIVEDKNATADQIKIRKAWLNTSSGDTDKTE